MKRRLHLVAVAALLTSAPGTASDEPGLYLYHLPVELAASGGLPLGDRVRLTLEVANPDYLAAQLETTTATVLGRTSDRVELEFDSLTLLDGEPLPRHSAASFVVDFDELAIAKLVPQFRKRHGSTATIDELIAFADASIPNKSYRRTFDIASRVAQSGEGDCTEHAVLLAALARAVGRPARVVIGILLIETADEVAAFGHAWTEIHDGDRWRVADATQPQSSFPAATAHYLPLLELGNEGPGYALAVVSYAALQPSGVNIAQPARQTATP